MLLCFNSVFRYLVEDILVRFFVALSKNSGISTFWHFNILVGMWQCWRCHKNNNRIEATFFHFSFVISNSPAEGNNTTEVVFGLVFNNTIPKDELPRNEAIVQTLVDAANSNSYSVKLSSSPIHIICKSTSHFTAACLSLVTFFNYFLPFLLASPKSRDTTTVAPVTTQIVLSSGTREKIINVSFRSRLSTFTIELTNASSASFTNRALMIKSQVCIALDLLFTLSSI